MNYELGKKKNKSNHGFVALMSVIIISVILLLVATTLSRTGFSGRLNILDSEYKERSSALAEACVDTALLKLATEVTYASNLMPDIVPVGADRCTVNRPFDSSLDPITFETSATFQNATTNLRVKVAKSDLSVVYWEEVP